MSEPKKLAIAVLIDTLMDKHEAEVAALKAEVQRLEGNILGWKCTVMGQDNIVKCRDEEIERLRNELTNRSEAIRELLNERADNRWRPIETAPMDGTDILCWCVEPEFEGEENPHTEQRVCFFGQMQEDYSCWMSHYGYEQRPTHWMPLPQPPTK